MKSDCRILLVGEPGVGKSSLILSLISEEFPDDVPAKAEEITIPADVTPEKVPTTIVDYSAQEQGDTSLQEEITMAHVICVVYSVEDCDSREKITSTWMPLLRQILPTADRKPVILVGNKSDTLEVSNMENILPIMNEYSEIETCVECSAKTLKNVSEVFYYAQKAVLHPTAPLYIAESKEMTSQAREALSRVFKICDLDNDGVLNDREIYQFQRRCFNVPLQPQALEDVKMVVRKHTPEGVLRDGVTWKGFLFLHTLFIQRGRHETTWTVLRKFGYDDSLQLDKSYLTPSLSVPPDSSTELTHQGYQFLANLFEKHDDDRDGFLNPTELQSLFSTCAQAPWDAEHHNSVPTNAQGWLSFHGFLAQWTLTCSLDVHKVMKYLAYLGYMYEHDSLHSAIHVTRDRKIDIERKQTNRNVFRCDVMGATGVGKTVFLQGLLGRNLQYIATLQREALPTFAINTVPVYGQDKYLLLHEAKDLSDDCDVVCLLYDVACANSFAHVRRLYEEIVASRGLPCLFVGSKADRCPMEKSGPSPAQYCKKHGLPQPVLVSSLDRINIEVYCKLATIAAYPRGAQLVQVLTLQTGVSPFLRDWFYDVSRRSYKGCCKGLARRHTQTLNGRESKLYLRAGLGAGVVALVSFLLYRYWRN